MGQYGEAGKGALGGAMGGAAAGAGLGPWGALAGGVIGGATGLLSGWAGGADEERQRQLIEEYKKGMNSSFAQDQKQLIEQLKMQANGQGPSMANLQMTNSMDKNNAGMSAMAQSGRGNAGAAAQAAMNAGATSNMGIAAQAGVQRLDEQQRARELWGMNAMQGRQMDMQQADRLYSVQSGQVGKPSQGDMLMASGLRGLNAYAVNRAQSEANAQKTKPTAQELAQQQAKRELAAQQAKAAQAAADAAASAGRW